MERSEKEKLFWDKFATQKAIESKIADSPTETILKIIDKTIEGMDKKPVSIMELGSGTGRLTIPVAKKYKNAGITGIDISSKMNTIAKRKAKGLKNINFITTNGRELPITDIDFIYSITVFQHIDEEGVKSYLNEIYKVLNKGGMFLFQFVEGNERNEFSQQYSLEEMASWISRAGFSASDTGFKLDNSIIGTLMKKYPNWKWALCIK